MIIDKYINSFSDFLSNYYKIILGSKYNKSMIDVFKEKYINVRYYNITEYGRGYSFVDRINKELKDTAKELIKLNPKYEDRIKQVFSMFAYILYIDDCSKYTNLNSLINTLCEDMEFDGVKSLEIKEFITGYIKKRKDFFKLLDNKEFTLKEKRLARNIKKVTIEEDCKIPLYSDYAKEKAYNSGTVVENKQYLLFLMLSIKVLNQIVDLNYNECYVVDFPESLFAKEKKINKYLEAINNKAVKTRISLSFSYSTYIKYKDRINSLISDGYNISVVLDDTYDNNIKVLDLFSYIFVYEKYEYYDIIIDNRENIKAKVVSL